MASDFFPYASEADYPFCLTKLVSKYVKDVETESPACRLGELLQLLTLTHCVLQGMSERGAWLWPFNDWQTPPTRQLPAQMPLVFWPHSIRTSGRWAVVTLSLEARQEGVEPISFPPSSPLMFYTKENWLQRPSSWRKKQAGAHPQDRGSRQPLEKEARGDGCWLCACKPRAPATSDTEAVPLPDRRSWPSRGWSPGLEATNLSF